MRWSFFSVLYRHNYFREFGTRELSHVQYFSPLNVLGAGQGAGKVPTKEETVFSNRTHLCLTSEVLSPQTSTYGGVFRLTSPPDLLPTPINTWRREAPERLFGVFGSQLGPLRRLSAEAASC
jgi:hypothetical protein